MNNVAMLQKLVVALRLTIQAANMNMQAGYRSDTTQASTEG